MLAKSLERKWSEFKLLMAKKTTSLIPRPCETQEKPSKCTEIPCTSVFTVREEACLIFRILLEHIIIM